MTYGFKITDDKHTRTDADIGFTLIGTDSFLGTGTFKFTFPLETAPAYVTSWLGTITDAPTTDTIEPVFHLGIIPIWTLTFAGVVTNVSGLCLVNGDFDSSITTASVCNSTSGGVWNTTTPYFAYFEGGLDYEQIGKWDDDSCYSGTNTFSDLKDNTEVTLYFMALGG